MDWTSYDAAAEAHERLRVPLIFAAPARDLAARMELGAARRLLDVGTGSGVVARAAAGCSVVVGVDPSFEMARVARQSGVTRVAAAGAPGLPFGCGSFDRVTAGFVLSHVAECDAALRDMARVLGAGGLLGATAWADRGSEHRDVWQATLERFVGREALVMAEEAALPHEERLSREGALREALAAAGLAATAERVAYPIAMTMATFLEMRETSVSGRFARARLDAAEWARFREAVAGEFARRFRDPIDHTLTAWIAVGRK
jgi:SAM-dependent methyltransferase